MSVWVGVRVAVTQTWAASLRLAGMSNNRKKTQADYGCSLGSVDLTVGCTVSQIWWVAVLCPQHHAAGGTQTCTQMSIGMVSPSLNNTGVYTHAAKFSPVPL